MKTNRADEAGRLDPGEAGAAGWLAFATESAGIGCWRWRPADDRFEADTRTLGLLACRELSTTGDFLAALHESERANVAAALRSTAAGVAGALTTVETRLASLEPRWVELKFRAVAASASASACVEGIVLDATARRANEERRRDLEERLRQSTESADVVYWDLDLATGWTRCSPNAVAIWGLEEGPVEKFLEPIHPEDRDAVKPKGEAGERGYRREYRVRDRSGKWRWIDCRGDVVPASDGRPARMIGISLDVTERKCGEEALREAQARERAYLDNLPVGVWFINVEGGVSYANVAARQIWAGARFVPLDKLGEYKAWWHGTDRLLQAHEWAGARAILRGEASLNEVLDIECFDGSRKTILNSAVPVRDTSGKKLGAVIFNQDVTALKDAERKLRESERTLRSFYETSPLLMGVVELPEDDSDIIHVYDNPATERLHGAPAGGLAGRTSRELGASTEDIVFWTGRYRESERRGLPVQFERSFRKDGREIWVLCVVACIGASGAGRTRFSYVAKDITERRNNELALREAQAQLTEHASRLEHTVAARTAELREANEQLETFVYSVAHDLRGPLRAVTGFAQLLVDDYVERLDETARHMLERIQGASEFMDRLVLDLLSFGRAARAEIELAPVCLARAWESAWFQNAVQAEQTGATVELVEPMPPVRGHEATLGQMLANLLSNALKFVGPGVTPRVRVWAEPRGEFVRLWVEDNGIGIPPEQHERVFRVFERLHGARYAGTGVGLAIVRKGAERMGGRAGLESAPGEGCRFWIELPRG